MHERFLLSEMYLNETFGTVTRVFPFKVCADPVHSCLVDAH